MTQDIVPYADVSASERAILDLLASRLRRYGYVAGSGWIRNGKEYEVYSQELDAAERGKVAAYARIGADKIGSVVTPRVMEKIKLIEGNEPSIECIEFKGITPYQEADKEAQKILKALGKEIRRHGYTAGRGWVRDGKEYEVYSVELAASKRERGEVACSAIVRENGVGYLTTESVTKKIEVTRNERDEIVVMEVEGNRKRERER